MQKADKKGTKKHAGKTSSLRRVAVEAQRSRQGFVKGRGNKRFVAPHVDTKVRQPYQGGLPSSSDNAYRQSQPIVRQKPTTFPRRPD
jgi:hypothetical protein